MKSLRIIFLTVSAILVNSANAIELPVPPNWGGNFRQTPQWWTNVADEYETFGSTNYWTQIDAAEKKIKNDTGHGLSVTAERRQVIKYATHILQTLKLKEEDAEALKVEIASMYSSLGDYKRSILAFSERLRERPDCAGCMLELAMNYERIGDRARAIEVYKFMDKEYENDNYLSEYSNVGKTGIACLTGAKIGCRPRRPMWWGQFQSMPDWLTNVQTTIPPVTCFRDGLDYIAGTVAKEHDPQKEIKAWEELSHSVPLSYQDKTTIYMEFAVRYSEIGDYHRSIICGWRVLDEYPSDVQMCKSALTWMSIDFEKLGDTNEVAGVKNALECYSKYSK